MDYSAFTSSYSGLSNRLVNKVTVESANYTIETDAQWDTGATGTCIAEEVAVALHLIPIGRVKVATPTGEDIRNTYCVDIILPNHVTFPNVIVIDSEIGKQGIGLLVGMDIIMQGDFAVSNFNGKTIFTFRHPSQGNLNFVKDQQIRSLIGPPHGKGRKKK